MKSDRIFGILGGMGTAAGLTFQELFFEVCNANGISGDQNYPEWFFLNASKAPDRTLAIMKKGPSPVAYLVAMMKKMALLNVSAVVVTCNTAHHYEREVFGKVPVPWIHLQRETARHVSKSGISHVGVLATEGTIRTRLFQGAGKLYGLSVSEPHPESSLQKRIMKAIYDPDMGIKYSGSLLTEGARSLIASVIDEMETDALIAGCTELSFALKKMNPGIQWFDPLAIAAQTLFDLWKEKRSLESIRTHIL